MGTGLDSLRPASASAGLDWQWRTRDFIVAAALAVPLGLVWSFAYGFVWLTARGILPQLGDVFDGFYIVGGVLVGYVISRPLVALSRLPTRAGMPLAMGLVLVSLFILVSRKKAITQVIGFLMLENGLALLAVLGTYGVPLIVELGVFLDALLGFLVMQIFVYQIHETFESMDVERLSRLRH